MTQGPQAGPHRDLKYRHKIETQRLRTPFGAVWYPSEQVNTPFFFGLEAVSVEAHRSCSSRSLYLRSPTAGGPHLSGVPSLPVRGVLLGTSSGPTLQAVKRPLCLGSAVPIPHLSPLPPKGRRVPISLPLTPASPHPWEEQGRGLMEANPYFGSFLLAGRGSGIHGVDPGVLPCAMGLLAGAPAAACTAGGFQWSLWAPLQIMISHGYSELGSPQSHQCPVT